MKHSNHRLCILFAATALVACGGEDDHDHEPDASVAAVDAAPESDAAPREVITSSDLLVAQGPWLEAIMTGGPDDRAVIHLETQGAVFEWNLHGHEGGGTQILYEEFDVTSAEYVFVPPAQGRWWLLLRNTGLVDTTVDLRAELYGDLEWSWQ